MIQRQARGGAIAVGQHLRAGRHQRLDINRFRKTDPPFANALPDVIGHGLIANEFPPEQFGNNIAREIIGSRAESARDHEDIAMRQRFLDRRAHFRAVIGDGHLAVEPQPDAGQLAGDVREVRVDREAQHEFAAGIDQFHPHDGEPSQGRRRSQMMDATGSGSRM